LRADIKSCFRIWQPGSTVSTAAKLQSSIPSKHPTGSVIDTEMCFSVYQVNAVKKMIMWFLSVLVS